MKILATGAAALLSAMPVIAGDEGCDWFRENVVTYSPESHRITLPEDILEEWSREQRLAVTATAGICGVSGDKTKGRLWSFKEVGWFDGDSYVEAD